MTTIHRNDDDYPKMMMKIARINDDDYPKLMMTIVRIYDDSQWKKLDIDDSWIKNNKNR